MFAKVIDGKCLTSCNIFPVVVQFIKDYVTGPYTMICSPQTSLANEYSQIKKNSSLHQISQ